MSNYVKIPDWDHEAVKAERDTLRAELDQARLANQEMAATVLHASQECAKAQAACAEMRDVLKELASRINSHGWSSCGFYSISQAQLFKEDVNNIEHALSSDCGKGWISQEKGKVVFELTRFIRNECDWEPYVTFDGDIRIGNACNKILAALEETI